MIRTQSENVTEKYHPCHKASYSHPRILPLPSWASNQFSGIIPCFLHPQLTLAHFTEAEESATHWRVTEPHVGKAGPAEPTLHKTTVEQNCIHANTPLTPFGDAAWPQFQGIFTSCNSSELGTCKACDYIGFIKQDRAFIIKQLH